MDEQESMEKEKPSAGESKKTMSFWDKVKTYSVTGFSTAVDAAFEYDTPKIVHIKNKKVGLLNRLVQLIIIGYILGYAIVYQKGYQKMEEVVSSVTTKVQGVGFTDAANPDETNAGTRVWDSSDFVVPPQSPNSVFIMTNMWVTDQRQGICAETKYKQNCANNSMCSNGTRTENGVLTGVCDLNVSKCLVYAWCPIEQENKTMTNSGPKLTSAVNFTVLIKNSIQFPSLSRDFRRRNIDNSRTNCQFDFYDNFTCPVFKLATIIDMLEMHYTFDDLATHGAVLGLMIEWDCDLDYRPSKCVPKYSARRLDDPFAQGSSQGFNFRFANQWVSRNNDTGEMQLERQLIKAYGIRINILVSGMGGKFDAVTLILTIGSGIALLAVATVVSDVVVLYVLRERGYYYKKKYLNVTGNATIFGRDSMFFDNARSDRYEKMLSPSRQSETDDEDANSLHTSRADYGTQPEDELK